MTESGIFTIIGFVIFLFSLLFAYTGTLETCVYRRYIVPVMLLFIGIILWEQTIASMLIVFSVPLIYFGYKGQGIALKKEKIETEMEGTE